MPKRRANKKYKGRLPGDTSTDAPPPKRIAVGNISDISGNVNVAGGDITKHQDTAGLNEAEIRQLFDELDGAIESHSTHSPEDKENLRAEIKDIQSAVTEARLKNENIDEEFLWRRLRNIARMAPDVLDVIVATLGNPLARLGVAVTKIAEKAKVESRMPDDSSADAPPPDKKKKKRNPATVEIHGENVIGHITAGGAASIGGIQISQNAVEISPRMAGDISTDAPPPDTGKKKKRKGR